MKDQEANLLLDKSIWDFLAQNDLTPCIEHPLPIWDGEDRWICVLYSTKYHCIHYQKDDGVLWGNYGVGQDPSEAFSALCRQLSDKTLVFSSSEGRLELQFPHIESV